jgi:histidyl-tRNA synthetase
VQDPLADLEIMLLAWDIYDSFGFQNLAFQVHSTGCPICRPQYVNLLAEHYRAHAGVICDDCKRRATLNPLRVLDCKQPQCQPVIASAPKLLEHLCGECAAHFTKLRGYLEHLGKPYTINSRLVRGLDYYTKTVFEVWAEGIGAQAAVCGGGRYDGLIELLGGRPTPGVGFAAGMERAVMVMQAQHIAVPPLAAPLVFIAFWATPPRATLHNGSSPCDRPASARRLRWAAACARSSARPIRAERASPSSSARTKSRRAW